jgi:hypothetical protein
LTGATGAVADANDNCRRQLLAVQHASTLTSVGGALAISGGIVGLVGIPVALYGAPRVLLSPEVSFFVGPNHLVLQAGSEKRRRKDATERAKQLPHATKPR